MSGFKGRRRASDLTLRSKPLTFGRDDQNDVVLPSVKASRVHAEVRLEADGYVLQDRGSRNGTLVNGKSVTSHRLRPGDEIAIGDETFRFEPDDVSATVVAEIPRPVAPSPSGPVVARHYYRGRAGWTELCPALGGSDGAAGFDHGVRWSLDAVRRRGRVEDP